MLLIITITATLKHTDTHDRSDKNKSTKIYIRPENDYLRTPYLRSSLLWTLKNTISIQQLFNFEL